jgi:translation initiation factor 4E
MVDSIWSRRTNEKSSFLASAGVKKPESEASIGSEEIRPAEHHDDHVLSASWTVWFLYRGPGVKISNYLLATKQVGDFSTVEGFWHVYLHLRRVDKLPFTSEFQIFRQGVKPMWEDPINVQGGKWVVRFRRSLKGKKDEAAVSGQTETGVAPNSIKYNHIRQQTAVKWEKLLLAVVGGTLCEEVPQDEVVGAVVSVRRDEDIISVWTRSGNIPEYSTKIKEAIKAVLDLDSDDLEYKVHADSIKEGAEKQALYSERSDKLEKYERERHEKYEKHEKHDRYERPVDKHGHHGYGHNSHFRHQHHHHNQQQKHEQLQQQNQGPQQPPPPFGVKGVLDQAIAQSVPSSFLRESASKHKSNGFSHVVDDKW